MKTITPTSIKLLVSLILIPVLCSNSFGDIILREGDIDVSRTAQEGADGAFIGGTTTFDLTGIDSQDIELLANFDIVDAGVRISVNGMPLYPDFVDISQFGPDVVFTDTGVTQGTGNIENPFTPNNSGLDRLIVSSTSAGTDFSGAAFVSSTEVIDYTPNFAVQDFSSLLVAGENTIDFFVLNAFDGANLQGDFTVTQIEAATVSVPEPNSAGLMLLASLTFLANRRRR